jgi:prepilin-type N-terminal cleavage/methylation domain-containing protein
MIGSWVAKETGFSLIEIIVALAIGTVLVTMAVPNMMIMSDRNKTRAAALDVRAGIQKARSMALKESRDVRVSFSQTAPADYALYYRNANGTNGALIERMPLKRKHGVTIDPAGVLAEIGTGANYLWFDGMGTLRNQTRTYNGKDTYGYLGLKKGEQNIMVTIDTILGHTNIFSQ